MTLRIALFLLLCASFLPAAGFAAPLEVRVRDAASGEPVAGALVELHGPEGEPACAPFEEVTGDDGTARFGERPAGRYRPFLRKEGLAPAPPARAGLSYHDPAGGFVHGHEPTRVELLSAPPIFTPTGGVRGRITAAPGDRPVRDAGVLVAEGGRDGKLVHATATNSQGGFAVYGVAPGAARVTVTASGYGKVDRSVMIAPGRTLDLPVALGAGAGRIVGSLFSDGGVPIPGVHVSATRSDGILVSSAIVDVRGGADRAVGYALEGVPALPPGSTLTYTVRAASSGATMTSPTNGVTGLAVRAPGQTVTATPIRLAAMQGGLRITLYHGLPLAPLESEAQLSSLAAQALVSVEGTNAYGRYAGEGPARFYRYNVSGAPAGSRRLRVSFPGHSIAPGQETIFIPVGGEASVLLDLRER